MPLVEFSEAVRVMVEVSTPAPMPCAVAVMTEPFQPTLLTYFDDWASKPLQPLPGSELFDDAYSATAVRRAEAASTTSETFDFLV